MCGVTDVDEKKLTDEEIIKALECCINDEGCDCGNCPDFTKEKLCHKANAKQSLDLIHRLQEQNGKLKTLVSHFEQLEKALSTEIEQLRSNYENLKERYVKVLDLNEKVIAEQKEIIEKQVKIYEKLENSYGELVQKNAEQKAEIERLTELQSRGGYRVAELSIENAELQKQVEELKNENAELKEENKQLFFKERYGVEVE